MGVVTWTDNLVVVLVGGEHGFPEGAAGGGIQAQSPLLAVRLRGGEGASAGYDDGGLAFADGGAPEFFRAVGGPLPEQAGGGIDIVAIVGQKADIGAVSRPRSGQGGQQDQSAQDWPERRVKS